MNRIKPLDTFATVKVGLSLPASQRKENNDWSVVFICAARSSCSSLPVSVYIAGSKKDRRILNKSFCV